MRCFDVKFQICGPLFFSLVVYLQMFIILILLECQIMTSEAEIESVRFTKSVIKSSAALSYIEAQARMDDRFFCSILLFISQVDICRYSTTCLFLDVANSRLFWFFCTQLSRNGHIQTN